MRACCILLLLAAQTAMPGTDGNTSIDLEDGENDEHLADNNSVINSIEIDLDLNRKKKKKSKPKLKPSKATTGGKGKRGKGSRGKGKGGKKSRGQGNGKGKGKGKGKGGKGSEGKSKGKRVARCPTILRSGKKETLILKYIFDPDCPPPSCAYISPQLPLSNDKICLSDIPNPTRCSDNDGNLCYKNRKRRGPCSSICSEIQNECNKGSIAPGVCNLSLWCSSQFYTCCRNGVYITNYNCNFFHMQGYFGGYCDGNLLIPYIKDCCTELQQTCSLAQSRCENCPNNPVGSCQSPCSCPNNNTCPAYSIYPICPWWNNPCQTMAVPITAIGNSWK